MEMLQAMKQKTTPGAVVVKSSPRDSPSSIATGKNSESFHGSQLVGSIPPAWWDGDSFVLVGPWPLVAANSASSLPKEPPVPPLLLDPDKPVGIAISVPEAQKTAEPSRLDQLRPQELPRVKESTTTLAEKPRLNDGHPGKKALSILSYVRGPLPKDIPVPLSHSMNGKSKPWEPFIAEEFAHQFHESVLQSTQKALQKHKGNGRGVGGRLANSGLASLWGGRPPLIPHTGVWHCQGHKIHQQLTDEDESGVLG